MKLRKFLRKFSAIIAASLIFTICTGTVVVLLSLIIPLSEHHQISEKADDGATPGINFPVVVEVKPNLKMNDGSPADIKAVIILGLEDGTKKKINVDKAYETWRVLNSNPKIIRAEKSWEKADGVYSMYVEYVPN